MNATNGHATPAHAARADARPPFPASVHLLPPRNRPSEYFVLDFETTGLSPQRCEVIEVACVRVVRNHVAGSYGSLVRAKGEIPAGIARLTGIDDAMLADAPSFEEAMAGLGRFMGRAARPAFMHNADFDARVMWAHGVADFIEADCPVCCSLLLAQRAFPLRPSHSLEALSKDLGIVAGRAHRALDDCLATAQLIDICYSEEERRAGLADPGQGQLSLTLSHPPCPRCGSGIVAKDGFTQAGTQMYRCKDCGKKYSEKSRIAAPDRRRATPTFSEARASSPTGQLPCPRCRSTRLTRCGKRGASSRFRCLECGTRMTFREDAVR